MLLITNFDVQLTGEPAILLELATQVAQLLNVSLDQTLVISVSIQDSTPFAYSAKEGFSSVQNENERSYKVNLNRLAEAMLAAGLAHFSASPHLDPYPPSAGRPSASGAITTSVRHWPGQSEKEAEEEEIPGNAQSWRWQDNGPVVIIPPSASPSSSSSSPHHISSSSLSMYLGHAISHYLHDNEVWSPFYVVTNYQPFNLMAWD